jgi:hypothetical protein
MYVLMPIKSPQIILASGEHPNQQSFVFTTNPLGKTGTSYSYSQVTSSYILPWANFLCTMGFILVGWGLANLSAWLLSPLFHWNTSWTLEAVILDLLLLYHIALLDCSRIAYFSSIDSACVSSRSWSRFLCGEVRVSLHIITFTVWT